MCPTAVVLAFLRLRGIYPYINCDVTHLFALEKAKG